MASRKEALINALQGAVIPRYAMLGKQGEVGYSIGWKAPPVDGADGAVAARIAIGSTELKELSELKS